MSDRLGPFEQAELLTILPHRPPFLFVDRVIELQLFKRIVAERLLRSDEPQFVGHFPGRPIMPGVLVTEALAQTSGLLLGLSRQVAKQQSADGQLFYLGASNIKFLSPAIPGETLLLKAECERDLGVLSRFTVEASVGKRLVVTGTITLAQVEGRV